MEKEAYQIKTSSFEGPLGLLLSLVEKRKLFINDVSLSIVTEDYLQYINKLGGLPSAEISNFIFESGTITVLWPAFWAFLILVNMSLIGSFIGLKFQYIDILICY